MRRTTDPDTHATDPPGRLTLTGEGLAWLGATVVLGGVGWLKSINLVLILAYLMATLMIFNGLLARLHVRRVAVGREPAPPPHAGEDAPVRLTVSNTGRQSATVSVEDHAGDQASGWFVSRLAAGASATCAGRATFPARGRFTSSVRVSSGFPFGLIAFERAATGADLIVLPAVGVADPDGLRRWVLRQAGGDGRARKVLRRVTTDHADVRGVRPYRPGDAIRSVHWRSSARRGELMVREYDAAPSPELVLVVEPWLPAEPTPAALANLERALCLAATIARTWSRTFGTRVTVAIAGDPASIRTSVPTESAVRAALVPLAEVKGGTTFDALGPGVFDRSLLKAARVVVSSRPLSPYAATLTRSTGRPFVAVAPADRPPWYQPPVIRDQKSETRGQKMKA